MAIGSVDYGRVARLQPEAAAGERLPALPGGSPDLGEGAARGNPGSLNGGVSSRRVDDLAHAMGVTGVGTSTVSKLCKDIDERVNAFLDRPSIDE